MGEISFYQRPPSQGTRIFRELLAERQYEATHGVTTTTGSFTGVCDILAAKGYDLTKAKTSGAVTVVPHPKRKTTARIVRVK